MASMDFYELETKYGAGVYAKQELSIVRGQGASLFDVDGNEYLDCTSGHGVANLGHAHPKVAAAIAEQASTLITLFESFPNDKRATLMEKMVSLVPGLERVFLCNSGAEAVEAALKFARLSTGQTSSPPCALSTDGPLGRSRRHSVRSIDRASNRWCRDLAMCPITTSKRWKPL
jgi:acetylornithine/LysW-gamma-L-lysine aminotransferase